MHTGPWVKMKKPLESSQWGKGRSWVSTLIHDDAAARALGFAGGFVGGASLEGVMATAIFISFGHTWYESGASSVRILKPVYNDEEVRVVWEESETDPGDKRKIAVWLEKQDGDRVAAGWAAIGEPGEKLTPPWQRNPTRAASPPESADDLLPYHAVGDTYPLREYRVTKDEAAARLDSFGDQNLWYRLASPWGGPIINPSQVGDFLHRRGAEDEVERPKERRSPQFAMYVGVDVVVYGPVFLDHTYRIGGWLCEKGLSPRSAFLTREYTLEDDKGMRLAIARFPQRFLLSAIRPESKV